ncbi:DUF1232 domain-containing protein [Elioraea sp.]|jgi:uncharacterized membrane protein YkvA (DUF1232 family)|uniref:DUF1232 domain-containing protein n=1 Tax=Elioraea sp. TaxID=2185103 RepID=UPI0021DD7B6C|nr:DUF1232 domain-containing protein [Elioraea sp.]GIX11874.1 MAG: hypothetical protein KatS3mg116_3584 [Elioraea sp.]
MSRTARIRAIIAKHRAQGHDAVPLAIALRNRMGSRATPAEIDEAVAFCREILDAVPVLIDRLREAAGRQGLAGLIEPMLAHAESYFVDPVDRLPETLLGELGLLDDAYLALHAIRMVQVEPDPLIRIDLGPPMTFLEQVLGESTLARLKAEMAASERLLLREAARWRAAADEQRRREAARRPAEAPLRPAPRPTPGRRMCTACSGLGSATCGACAGYGYHTSRSTRVDWRGNAEYVTERTPCSCSGGQVICRACGGSGYV